MDKKKIILAIFLFTIFKIFSLTINEVKQALNSKDKNFIFKIAVKLYNVSKSESKQLFLRSFNLGKKESLFYLMDIAKDEKAKAEFLYYKTSLLKIIDNQEKFEFSPQILRILVNLKEKSIIEKLKFQILGFILSHNLKLEDKLYFIDSFNLKDILLSMPDERNNIILKCFYSKKILKKYFSTLTYNYQNMLLDFYLKKLPFKEYYKLFSNSKLKNNIKKAINIFITYNVKENFIINFLDKQKNKFNNADKIVEIAKILYINSYKKASKHLLFTFFNKDEAKAIIDLFEGKVEKTLTWLANNSSPSLYYYIINLSDIYPKKVANWVAKNKDKIPVSILINFYKKVEDYKNLFNLLLKIAPDQAIKYARNYTDLTKVNTKEAKKLISILETIDLKHDKIINFLNPNPYYSVSLVDILKLYKEKFYSPKIDKQYNKLKEILIKYYKENDIQSIYKATFENEILNYFKYKLGWE